MEISAAPPLFAAALQSLQMVEVRDEMQLAEAPAPHRVAPFAVAVDGELDWPGCDAHGKFMLFYDPAGQSAWEGEFRVVTYCSVTIPTEQASDLALHQVAWSWVQDAIDGLEAVALSGTVTVSTSQSFGEIAGDNDKSVVEIRASWSPRDENAGDHMAAWTEILGAACGLEPSSTKVESLTKHRSQHAESRRHSHPRTRAHPRITSPLKPVNS